MQADRRYHGLDALRAGAMLLGLVLHASQFYLNPDQLPWIVLWATTPAPEATDVTGMTSIWIHLWRMPVFFLLAGFFVQMTIERKGPAAFWADRALRIFAVLVVFQLALVLILGRPSGTLAHLWFLWLLSFFCLLAPVTGHLVTGWIFARPARAGLCLIPVIAVGLLNRENIWHDVPGRYWDLEWTAFALYCVFFVLGQSLWKSRDFLERLRAGNVVLALFGIGTASFGILGAAYYTPLPDTLRQTLVGLATLGWGFGLIGLAERWITAPAWIIRQGVEVSYSVYLFHRYIIYNLSALTIEAGWHQHLAIPLVSLAGFLASLACYLVLVRWTPLNWLLSGYATSPLRWRWAERRLGWRNVDATRRFSAPPLT